jgi:uncharacterized protein (DUF1800 family)
VIRLSRRDLLGSAALLALTGCGPGDWLLSAADRRSTTPDPEPGTQPDLARHLLDRCTFGARHGDHGALLALGTEGWIDAQLAPGSDRACDRLLDDLDVLHAPAGEAYEWKPQVVQDTVIRGTLLRAVYAERQLPEVVAGCWRDQFNVGAGKGDVAWLVAAYDREVVRAHALGRFRDLLRASLTHPAMLWYLDGRSNRREHPNENHARELLELHTLGVHGGYTQRDVMEVARCLSGWTVRGRERFRKARVEFVAELHDDGAKDMLGTHIPAGLGAGDVDRLVELLAAHPATATRVAHRLCARFIADDPPAAAVTDVAATFTASDGDLRATVRAVLAHPTFRDPRIRGGKLKRPLHYLASCLRILGVPTRAEPDVLTALARMGEAPYQHPTPEGYPEAGTAWTGTLWWRWRTAYDLAHAHPEADLDPQLVFGRQPTPAEQTALDGPLTPAEQRTLLLASPAFQRC